MLRLVERLSLFPYTTLFRAPPRVRRSALITALSTSAGGRQGCGVPSSKCGSCASRSGWTGYVQRGQSAAVVGEAGRREAAVVGPAAAAGESPPTRRPSAVS